MTNDSAMGYVILAMKGLGYSLEEINQLIEELHFRFDTYTEADAEDYFQSLKWQENSKKEAK